jgi:hypothetical protein
VKARNLLLVSLAAFGVLALPAATAHALLVKVQINFGPTIVGPDNGTLIVQANAGDFLRITWALGTDTDTRPRTCHSGSTKSFNVSLIRAARFVQERRALHRCASTPFPSRARCSC